MVRLSPEMSSQQIRHGKREVMWRTPLSILCLAFLTLRRGSGFVFRKVHIHIDIHLNIHTLVREGFRSTCRRQ